MKIRDRETWKGYSRTYSSEVMKLAERLADLIEARMARGAKLEHVAEDAVNRVNTSNMSGSMYGAVVTVLAGAWEHGTAFQRWENKR